MFIYCYIDNEKLKKKSKNFEKIEKKKEKIQEKYE